MGHSQDQPVIKPYVGPSKLCIVHCCNLASGLIGPLSVPCMQMCTASNSQGLLNKNHTAKYTKTVQSTSLQDSQSMMPGNRSRYFALHHMLTRQWNLGGGSRTHCSRRFQTRRRCLWNEVQIITEYFITVDWGMMTL